MLDAQEEAKALQQREENPFAALQQGISSGYGVPTYSRYELAAAWSSICAHIADSEGFAMSVALNDSVLETGDIQQTPFPVALTYLSDKPEDSWGAKQIAEHPEYLERLKQILEESLQTVISLSVKTRAYNEAEKQIRKQAQMSPYELDLEKEPGLQKLKQLFAAELIYSHKSSRQMMVPQQSESCDTDSEDNG